MKRNKNIFIIPWSFAAWFWLKSQKKKPEMLFLNVVLEFLSDCISSFKYDLAYAVVYNTNQLEFKFQSA